MEAVSSKSMILDKRWDGFVKIGYAQEELCRNFFYR